MVDDKTDSCKSYKRVYICCDEIGYGEQSFECGIRLDVLESEIPFDDYLKYSWNQLKSLN